MKKLLSSLILFSLVMGFGLSDSNAKSSRWNKNDQKQSIQSQKTSRKSQYSALVYEGVWFSSLTGKQQLHYLKTIEKLVLRLNRTRVSSLDKPFLQFFIPSLDARNRINNGFIFEGQNDDQDFDDFLAELNILEGPLDPKCSHPNQLCAPYLGMVCSGGRARLACSPDSTPTCTSRGSIECLKTALSGCGMDAKGQAKSDGKSGSAYCRDLDRMMQRGTQGVESYCNSRSRLKYCQDALASLQGEEVPASPEEAEPPLGRGCEQMTRELAEIKDNNRSGGSTARDKGVSNNSYWRNMIGFATQACGITDVNTAYDRYGVCSGSVQGSDPQGPDSLRSTGVVTYKTGEDGFDTCIQSKLDQSDSERSKLLAAASKSFANDKAGRRARIAEVTEKYDKIVSSIKARSECTQSVTKPITDSKGNAVTGEFELKNLMPLASKIVNRQDLTREEKNKFAAATGLNLDHFVDVFCNSRNFSRFKERLMQKKSLPTHIIGQGSVEDLHRGQVKAARFKLAACSNRLKDNTGENGAGCKMYGVQNQGNYGGDRAVSEALRDGNILRCASKQDPVLAYNPESKTCMIVTGKSHELVETTENGAKIYQHSLQVRTPGSRSKKMNIKSLSHFAKSHELQVYRCHGDRKPSNTCYRTDVNSDADTGYESETSN